MRIVSVGEVMVELSAQAEGLWSEAIAGDTFNTAVYVKALRPQWSVGYATGLGTDPFSQKASQSIEARGLQPLIHEDEQRGVGLYAITLKEGERSFTYWRSASAARRLAEDRDWLSFAFEDADYIYLSGITLAILEGEGRETLLSSLAEKKVVFDPNIRPKLWESPEVMRDFITRAASLSTIVLPSFEDEAAAFGDQSVEDTFARYAKAGAAEIVVKNGADLLIAGRAEAGEIYEPPEVVIPVDTTGAGDSFNAGYLAVRLAGAPIEEAVRSGQSLSAQVVQTRGAILPSDQLSQLAKDLA